MKTLLLLCALALPAMSAPPLPPLPPKVAPVTVKAMTAAMANGTLTPRQANYLWSVNDRKTLTARDVGHMEKGKWVDVMLTTHRISAKLIPDDSVGQFAMLNKMGKPVVAPATVARAKSMARSMPAPSLVAPHDSAACVRHVHLEFVMTNGYRLTKAWIRQPPGETWSIQWNTDVADKDGWFSSLHGLQLDGSVSYDIIYTAQSRFFARGIKRKSAPQP